VFNKLARIKSEYSGHTWSHSTGVTQSSHGTGVTQCVSYTVVTQEGLLQTSLHCLGRPVLPQDWCSTMQLRIELQDVLEVHAH